MKYFALSIILLSACGTAPVETVDPNQIDLTYNELTDNFRAQGRLMGEEVAIREAAELYAVREYAAPVLPGTEADPQPDVAQAYLVSIEVKGVVMRDGVPFELELDIESDDLEDFSTGTIQPLDPLTIEFQLENDMIDLKDSAMSGSVEIKKYIDDGAHPDNDDVRVGGKLGGVFDFVLSNGDALSGAFFATFGDEPEIDIE